MYRVLKQRRQQSPSQHTLTPNSRKQKPTVLAGDVDGAQRTHQMLLRLESIQQTTPESYKIVMEAYVSRQRLRWNDATRNNTIVCAADVVPGLLDSCRERHPEATIEALLPLYELTLSALATCATPRGDRTYADQAYYRLNELHNLCGDQVPSACYERVVQALCWQQANLSSNITCAQTAQELYDTYLAAEDEATECHEYLLEAHSKCPDGWKEARKSFNMLLLQSPTPPCKCSAYTNMILAYSKANLAEDAHQLLEEMMIKYDEGLLLEEPELIAFNSVIAAWGRQEQGRDMAEQALTLLVDASRTAEALHADTVSYNTVLHAHLKNKNRKQGLQSALDLVDRMERACQPNSFTYTTLVKCWLQYDKSIESIEEAERLLTKVLALWERGDTAAEPSNRILNMFLNACAKCRNCPPSKAMQWLDCMRQSDSYAPDIITYTSLLECWSKSSLPEAPQLATRLLNEAFERYNMSKRIEDKPNLRTFTMAILTLANNQGSLDEARSLLDRLVDMYARTQEPDLRPNAYPYNYVLKCAANTVEKNDRLEAFQVAARIYQDMRKSDWAQPDSFTYAFWFKCCNNLLPSNSELKEKCIRYAFDECCKEGLVSSEVLTRFVQGSSPAMIREILGNAVSEGGRGSTEGSSPVNALLQVKVEDLPSSWTRNARRPRK